MQQHFGREDSVWLLSFHWSLCLGAALLRPADSQVGPPSPDSPAAFVDLPAARSAAPGSGRLTEIVVLPGTAQVEAAEEALSLALVAMVGGTRPPVSLAMVHPHLWDDFGIDEVSVRRHAPQDFIVRFIR